MIKLKCENCGQMMKARPQYAGKKGRCPNCRSIVRAPGPQVPASVGDERAQRSPLQPSGCSTSGISRLRTTVGRFLIPNYDELSLFLMSVTMLLIFVCNPTVRQRSLHFAFSVTGIFWAGIYIIMYSCGLVLSGYHIFSSRQKSDTERYLMLFFAVLTNGISGICAGVYIFKHSILWLAPLPIWNIITGVALIFMLWVDIIDRQCIIDRDAIPGQVVISLAACLVVFFVCSYLLKLHWAITFSICVAYSTNLDRIVRRVYHRAYPQG